MAIHPLARWLNSLPLLAAPGLYSVFGWGILLSAVAASFARRLRGAGQLLPGRAVALLQAIVLLTTRLPCLAFEFELQQDESQMATQAITLLSDPVFYRACDGGSGGPLLSYVLWLPTLLGQEIDHFTARVTGLALVWLAILLLHATVARMGDELVARAASWSVTIAYAIANQIDFTSYHSEIVPLLLTAAGAWTLPALGPAAARGQRSAAVGCGLVLGCFPFSKLQATPIGLAIGLAGLAIVLSDRALPWRERAVRAGLLVAGSLIVPLVFLGVFAAAGVLERFVRMYLLAGATYAAEGSQAAGLLGGYLRLGMPLRELSWEGLAIAGMVALASVCITLARPGRARPELAVQAGCVGAILAGALVATLAPGRCYVHYLGLTFIPLGLVIGLAERRVAAACGLIVLAAAGLAWGMNRPTSLKIVATRATYADPADMFPAMRPLLALAEPGDRLVVWGWQSSYHVYAQLPLGWNGANSVGVAVDPSAPLNPLQQGFVIRDPGLRDYYQRELLVDFARLKPRFVIDAVGSNSAIFKDHARFGIHAWPEFAAIIDRDYRPVFASDVDRLYVRSDED